MYENIHVYSLTLIDVHSSSHVYGSWLIYICIWFVTHIYVYGLCLMHLHPVRTYGCVYIRKEFVTHRCTELVPRICTCTFSFVYSHMYILTCTFSHIHSHMYILICRFSHVQSHMYILTHVHSHLYILTCIFSYVHSHIYILTCRFSHVYSNMYILIRTFSHVDFHMFILTCIFSYRVAKTHRIPYLYRSFSAKVTYI